MSFLEKLQKGMQPGVGAAENENVGPDQPPEESSLPDGTAVFASYKKKGIPTLKENTGGGRSRRLITADNIDEMTRTPQEFAAENEIPPERPTAKITSKKTMANKKNSVGKNEGGWLNNEAQLTVNVYQTDNELVLQSAIAGIKVENLDVLIEDDVITIKGNRANPLEEKGDYFIEECYWGPFSRKVILPVEVDSSRADAAMKDGILTIRIPKIVHEKKKKVIVKN